MAGFGLLNNGVQNGQRKAFVVSLERRANMTADVKRALAWGFGLGVGFALAGIALGVFKR
jgi:hypothetical protein